MNPCCRCICRKTYPDRCNPDPVPGRWVGERTWPSDRIRDRTYFLNATGLAEMPDAEEAITLAPDQTVGLINPAFLPFDMETELPRDQSDDDNKSLIFDSEALAEDIEICGHPVVKLALSVDKPVAKVAVRLNDIRPDGSSWHVTTGLRNLTHRNGHAEPEALLPGEVYEVEVPLNVIAYRFKRGHRIRVSISESYWPQVWPSPEALELTVRTGVSRLVLPERPAAAKDLENLGFADPAPYDRSVITPTVAGNNKQELTGPDENGRYQVHSLSDSGGLLINAIGTEMRLRSEWISTIKKTDPNSSNWSGYFSIELKRGDWDIKTQSNFDLTSDKTNFHITTDLVVHEKDNVIFSREWKDSIPRDLG